MMPPGSGWDAPPDHEAIAFLTDFFDQAVIVPAVLAVGVALWASGWRRGALAWVLVVPGTLLLVGLAKLAVFSFGPPEMLPELLSPSGHTASAAVVYGGLAALLAPRLLPCWLRALVPAIAIGVLTGFTRLALHVHSMDDVVVGGAIGVAGAALVAAAAQDRPMRVRGWFPAAAAVLAMICFHGIRMPAEGWLQHAAQRMTAAGCGPARPGAISPADVCAPHPDDGRQPAG